MPPNNDLVIQLILDDISEIKKDVKELLQLKWKIVGAVSILSVIISILSQILVNAPK